MLEVFGHFVVLGHRDPLGLSDALSAPGSSAPPPRQPQLPSLQPSRPAVPPLSGRSQGSSSSGRSRSRRGRAEPDPLLADVAPPGSQVRPAAPTASVVSLEELERLDVASPFEPSPPDLEAAKGRALNAPIRIKKVSLR